MSKILNKCALALIFLFIVGTAVPVRAQTLGSTLYTTYQISSNHQTVSWTVCGSTQESEGCYGSGNLGPFGSVGALLEGSPSTNKDTVTRFIYVLDVASGSGANGVELYVYKKTDTITSEDDSVSVTLSKSIALPLVGGSAALSSMAANSRFIFVGTNQSPQAVRIQKSNLSVTQLGGFSPPINVTAITTDNYGYVTITQGDFNSGDTAFTVYSLTGESQEDGGGAPFMLNTVVAVLPATLPTSDSQPAKQISHRPKSAPEHDGQN